MKKKIFYAIVSVIVIIVGLFAYISKDKEESINVNAEVELNLKCGSAFLIEESTGKVLYAQNEEDKMYPASMTKMMGLLLVCEAIMEESVKLDDIVIISLEASKMGGSQVFLEPLEQISINELLKCVCIASANDAMYALSEVVGASNENFVKMMNNKCDELNLINTNFVNVTGFDDDNHYTCAKDMAIIAKELLKYKDIILPYTSIYDSYIRENTDNPFWLVNTNKMVKYYNGMDGLKTGYTSKAGFCLTSTAKRNDVRLISVIMKADTSSNRNAMTKTLLDYGFSKVKCNKLYEKDTVISTLSLPKAKQKKVDLYTKDDINLIYDGNLEVDNINKEIILYDNINVPISANSEVGYLLITYKDQQYKYPLIVKENIEVLSIKELLIQYIKSILF